MYYLLLSSQGSNILPTGTILPYIGDLSNIPHGWALCDGTNGTPDLRDRFITGAGNMYHIGDTGGENFHKLTIEEMPSHNHGNPNLFFVAWANSGGGGPGHVGDPYPCRPSTQANAGGDQSHENRPPFYAVYYIMRIM